MFGLLERSRQILCLVIAALLATMLYLNVLYPFFSSVRSDGYIPHGPISITDNQDFVAQGWPGSGTRVNPYVIENLSIEESGYDYCISVENTDAHFVMKNCRLSGSVRFSNVVNGDLEDSLVFGIVDLEWSHDCIILNNTISPESLADALIYVSESDLINVSNNIISPGIQSEFGVRFAVSDNCVLSRNVVKGNGYLLAVTTVITSMNRIAAINPSGLRPLQEYAPIGGGIIIGSGNGCVVSENRIIENIGDALRVVNSLDLVITGNEIHENDNGITLHHADRSMISGNSITGSLEMHDVTAATIVDNQFIDGSLRFPYVQHLDEVSHAVSNNTIDGLPLLYLVGETSSTVEAERTGQIILVNCSDTEIRNSIVEGFRRSIEFYYCSNSAVVNGRCSRIGMLNSNDCRVENFEIEGSSLGIYSLGIYLDLSPKAVIRNNTIHGKYIGIWLFRCSFSTISKNRIFEVEHQGIYSHHSDSLVIEENYVTNCGSSAIYLASSDHSLVINNTLLDNSGYGIRMSSSNVTIYYNSLSGNAEGNAHDNGTNNQWDDGVGMGNFWGDYVGVGVYNIPGSAGSVDRYPSGIDGSAGFRIQTQWIVYVSVFVVATIVSALIWLRNRRA